ncbi:hypothetical protein [Niallia sp. Krafla_26]
MKVVNGEEDIMIMTTRGVLIRMDVDGISYSSSSVCSAWFDSDTSDSAQI